MQPSPSERNPFEPPRDDAAAPQPPSDRPYASYEFVTLFTILIAVIPSVVFGLSLGLIESAIDNNLVEASFIEPTAGLPALVAAIVVAWIAWRTDARFIAVAGVIAWALFALLMVGTSPMMGP